MKTSLLLLTFTCIFWSRTNEAKTEWWSIDVIKKECFLAPYTPDSYEADLKKKANITCERAGNNGKEPRVEMLNCSDKKYYFFSNSKSECQRFLPMFKKNM